jgi:hypothetical protein
MQSVPVDDSVPADEYEFAGPAPKRMTAEQFSDALTQVTGVSPEATANDDTFVKRVGEKGSRPFVRASLTRSTPLMRTLGRPNREQVVTTRPSELTTLEALELSNGRPLSDLLDAGAAKLMEIDSQSAEETCRSLVRAALSREPSEEELALLAELAGDPVTASGLADVLWSIVMLPEFQLIR